MVKKFEEWINEGLWSKGIERSKTGEIRKEDEDDKLHFLDYDGSTIDTSGLSTICNDIFFHKVYENPSFEEVSARSVKLKKNSYAFHYFNRYGHWIGFILTPEITGGKYLYIELSFKTQDSPKERREVQTFFGGLEYMKEIYKRRSRYMDDRALISKDYAQQVYKYFFDKK